MKISPLYKVFSVMVIIAALGLTACNNMENRQTANQPETQQDFREARNEINQEINQLAQTIRQSNYEAREEIEENLEKRIDNLKQRVEKLEDQVDEQEMSQDFEAAEERLEELESRLNDWTIISEENWNEFQTNFARTADEFGNEMEALFTDNDYFDKENK